MKLGKRQSKNAPAKITKLIKNLDRKQSEPTCSHIALFAQVTLSAFPLRNLAGRCTGKPRFTAWQIRQEARFSCRDRRASSSPIPIRNFPITARPTGARQGRRRDQVSPVAFPRHRHTAGASSARKVARDHNIMAMGLEFDFHALSPLDRDIRIPVAPFQSLRPQPALVSTFLPCLPAISRLRPQRHPPHVSIEGKP